MINLRNTFMAFVVVAITACANKKSAQEVNSAPQDKPQEISYSTSDAKSIIKAVEMASGSWNKLWEQKDVQFTYSYKYPANGQEDLSTERYVFDTEQSWARYTQHDINVMPGTEGEVVQYYDGTTASMKHGDKMMDDPASKGGAEFLRKANYFWFVMMFKLDNPGAVYEYMGQEKANGTSYDKVKVTYDAGVTGKAQNDAYVLFINPETKMVDQFLFSLPIQGVNDPLILMKVKYQEINGLQIPTERHIFMPGPDGYAAEPNLVQTSTEVKFNNGFTAASFAL